MICAFVHHLRHLSNGVHAASSKEDRPLQLHTNCLCHAGGHAEKLVCFGRKLALQGLVRCSALVWHARRPWPSRLTQAEKRVHTRLLKLHTTVMKGLAS